jgi:cystathionine beta-lyase
MEKELSYSFEKSACRKDTNAEKYVLRKELFGTDNVEPVWVADMDIDTPEFVIDAVKERLKHPVFGYEEVPLSAYMAQIEWLERHHGVRFDVDDMFYSHSVVASMNAAIEAFSSPEDKIIVQTPVYPPFFHSVKNLGRKVLKNPLKKDSSNNYTFDLDDLRSKIDKDTKMLLLCSPHNPVGRVWKKEELESLLEVCLEHNIVVFADEIHCDLVYGSNKHIPFASLENAKEITISTYGVGKTFNMAGFAISTVVVEDEKLKKRFSKVHSKIHFAHGASLSHVAFEAAYKSGDAWLEELKKHLYTNYEKLKELCDRYSEYVKLTPIEATYLAWLECKGLGFKSNSELKKFFIDEAKLGLNPGISFGLEGDGYMRLNFAVSSGKMSKVISQLEAALKNRKNNG